MRRDLAVHEVLCGDDDRPAVVVPVYIGPYDPGRLLLGDLIALVPLALAQGRLLLGGIDELHVAAAVLGLVVAEHPDVGGDARAVEDLGRELHDAVDQVLGEQPSPDARGAAARVPVEQRGP